MRRKFIPAIGLAACLALVLAAAQSVEAQVRRTWMPPDPAINLTDDQLSRIREIQLKFQEEIMSLQIRGRRIGLELDELEWKGAAGAAIDSKLDELKKAEAELDRKYLDHRNEIRSVLNDEQRALFDRYGGLGLGSAWGSGLAPRWGMRWGGGRGNGWGRGVGWGPGMGRGFGAGWRPRMGRGLGAGWGPGMGRGFYCPWFRRW